MPLDLLQPDESVERTPPNTLEGGQPSKMANLRDVWGVCSGNFQKSAFFEATTAFEPGN